MIRRDVVSSNLQSVGYEEGEQMLEVEFKNGGVYRYRDVEPSLFYGLTSAPSAGKYFHQNIRHLPFEKVVSREPTPNKKG